MTRMIQRGLFYKGLVAFHWHLDKSLETDEGRIISLCNDNLTFFLILLSLQPYREKRHLNNLHFRGICFSTIPIFLQNL